MKTNSLTLNSNDYPELARLYPGQEVELRIKGSLRMKHLENTEEYVELNIDQVQVTEKEKMSVQDIMMMSLNKQQQTAV